MGPLKTPAIAAAMACSKSFTAPEWCRSASLNFGSWSQIFRTGDLGKRQDNALTPMNLILDLALGAQRYGRRSKRKAPARASSSPTARG